MRTNLSKTISLFFDSQIGINAFSLYFASFVTTTACQTATSPDATVMNNGKVVENPYEDPTVVRMLIDGKFACTATLIEESGRNLVLTAAHCVFKRPTDRNLYNPNQIQFDIKGSLYTAKSMIPYPQYKGDIKNDLALVFLDPSVRFPSVRKVGSSPREGDLVTIDGYGVFSLSYVLDDDDGDGMPNGRDYCPNTGYWNAAQIDSKGCAFDQWPGDFPATNPTGAHASGIRRRGTNYVSKIADGAIFLKETRYNVSHTRSLYPSGEWGLWWTTARQFGADYWSHECGPVGRTVPKCRQPKNQWLQQHHLWLQSSIYSHWKDWGMRELTRYQRRSKHL